MQINSIFKFARGGWLRLRNAGGVLASIDELGQEQYHHAPHDGAPVAYVAGVAASETIVFADQPDPADTIIVGADTFTFVAADPEAGEILIGADLPETLENIVAALVDHELVTAVSDETDTITVTAINAGADGNTLALDSTGANITTPVGNLLTGGVTRVQGTKARLGRIATDGTDVWTALIDDPDGTNANTWVKTYEAP